MKRLFALSALLAFLFVTAPVYAADKPISGTVTRVDMEQKMLVIKDSKGQETAVYWDDSTRLDGGPLQEGANAKLVARDDGGRVRASSIQVSGKAPAPTREKGPVQ